MGEVCMYVGEGYLKKYLVGPQKNARGDSVLLHCVF